MKRPCWPLLLGLSLCFASQARTVFVNAATPGATHDGLSWETAFLTVAAGVSGSVAGDEIWVSAGAYKELVNVSKGVALYGGFAGTESDRTQRDAVANATILDGDAKGTVVTCAATGVVVDGFTIRNCGANFKGVHVTGGTATLAGNTITAHRNFAVYVQARTTLTGNVVTTNDTVGVAVVGATAVLSDNRIAACKSAGVSVAGTATLTRNTILANEYGIALTSGAATLTDNLICNSAGYGARVTNGTLTLIGNTISGNSGYGVSASGGTTHLTNNLVAFNGWYGVYKGTYGAVGTVSHNNVFASTVANYSGLTDATGTDGNISVDPMFVGRAGSDFHLTSASPCIDAGIDSVVVAGQTDVDGKPRIIGAHVDIGACEYGAAAPPYTLPDVTKCLGVVCGTVKSSADDLARLNVEPGNPSLDLLDALRLARKVAGLETNP